MMYEAGNVDVFEDNLEEVPTIIRENRGIKSINKMMYEAGNVDDFDDEEAGCLKTPTVNMEGLENDLLFYFHFFL